MGFSTEVKAVLGIDTSKMPEDTRKVVEQFKKAAAEIEQDMGKKGATAGESFTKSLTNKLGNARFLGTTLATALSLNLPDLADKIANAVAGGSAEGWKRSVEIAERNAEVIEKIIEAHMSPAQLAQKMQKDLTRALNDNQQSSVSDTTVKRKVVSSMIAGPFAGLGIDKLLAAVGIGQTDAEISEQKAQKKLNVDTADLKVTLQQKETREQLAKLEEQEANAKERRGTIIQREAAVLDNIYRLEDELAKGGLTEVETATKKLQLAEKRNSLEEIYKDQKKAVLENEKRELDLAEKRVQLQNQKTELERDEAKLTDRGKLTIGELAELKGSSLEDVMKRQDEANRNRSFAFGANADLSSEAVAAKEKAQRVKDLEGQAEAARRGGDSAKSLDLLGQVGTLRDELTKSGFAKSTEGDPAKLLREQIAKDNEVIKKTLNDIYVTEQGKYTNQ